MKGKSQATDLYEVLGLEGAVSAEMLSAAKLYEEGIDAYLARDFDGALSTFERAVQKRPNDKAANVLIARCRRYQITPPPANWTGVSAMESK